MLWFCHSDSVTLFKSYCSSLYTGELWCRFTQSVYRKINVAYHGVFKKFMNFPRSTSNSLLFVYYNVPTFQELIRKYVISFRARLQDSINLLIADLLNSSFMASSCFNRRWFSLLNWFFVFCFLCPACSRGFISTFTVYSVLSFSSFESPWLV